MIVTQDISCELDLEGDGKRFGSLDLGFSDNRHAFDKIPIPVIVIRNGAGPSVLLTAGTHGDEYEGQVILRRLIHELNPAEIRGRIIILPALNYPAVLDDTRVSPLDHGNLNRSFPGQEGGLPTSAIAHFVSSRLLPLVDAGIDLHAGGSSAVYLPSAFLCTCNNSSVMRQSLAMIDAFNAPYVFVVNGEEHSTGFDPVAHFMNIPFISAELAGGTGIDINATKIGITGVKNVLSHLGLLKSERSWEPQTRYLNGIDHYHYLSAPYSGIFEPYQELGSYVEAGQAAGRLYSLEEVDRTPLELCFDTDGIIVVRRNSARVIRGSHVYLVAAEIERDHIFQFSDPS